MSEQLIHRGPDDLGFYSDREVALGFRRLSIIDLNTGEQPLPNEDETVWVVFNGEIYNYRTLREQLEKAGHRFRTQSDTETIVHAYEEYGLDFVEHLRGMFAIGLWDASLKRLVLARDRLGKKPLYYYRNATQLLFASELKALLQSPDVPRELDPVAIDEYLTFHYVPAPRTILKGVRKLEPGHLLVAKTETGDVKEHRYWNLEYEPKVALDEAEASAGLRETLIAAVRLRLVSDVPLGALLSGGIDSSIVVGLMAQAAERPVKTFTIGFEEDEYNELPFARDVARRFSTDHHEFMVRPDALGLAPKIVYYLDEPMGDSSAIPTYYVSQMAAQHVTVVLNGDGGDEAFGGYNHYAAVLRSLKWERLPQWFVHGLVRPLVNAWPEQFDYRRMAKRGRTFAEICYTPVADQFLRQVTTYPGDLRQALYTREFAELVNDKQEGPAEDYILSLFKGNNGMGPLDQMLRADTKTLLPGDFLVKMDRMSMAHSLEARSPFLDHEVVEFAAQLPEAYKRNGYGGKLLLKRTFADLLPENIQERKKQGFGVPIEKWFRKELRSFAYDTLLGDTTDRGMFELQAIKKLLDEHQAGLVDHSARLWTLLVLEMWQRQFTDVSYPQLINN